jgi:hypothetical protein
MKKLRETIVFFALLTIQMTFSQVLEPTEKSKPLLDSTTNCLQRYYYFPNLEAYFDTQQLVYYYQQDGQWIIAKALPNGYRGYSIYNKCSVSITDYDDENICQFLNIHKKKYPYITNEKFRKLTVSNE